MTYIKATSAAAAEAAAKKVHGRDFGGMTAARAEAVSE